MLLKLLFRFGISELEAASNGRERPCDTSGTGCYRPSRITFSARLDGLAGGIVRWLQRTSVVAFRRFGCKLVYRIGLDMAFEVLIEDRQDALDRMG